MTANSTFPTFIKVDASQASEAFQEFAADGAAAGAAAGEQIKRHFKGSLDEVSRMMRNALTLPPTSAGGMDLGVDQYRAAAAAAQVHAEKMRIVAEAAQRLVASTDALSDAEQVYIAKVMEALRIAEQDLLKKNEQVAIAERLQSEVNQSALATANLTNANRALAQSYSNAAVAAGAHRQSMIGIGQQLQDAVIQLQAGTSAFVVFAQQGSQAAFMMSNMGGRVGAVARVLSGPWGAALFVATSLLGGLTKGLFDNSAAAKAAEEASRDLAARQMDLANFFDLATGAIREQNATLVANAILKRQSKIDALKEAAEKSRQQAFRRAGTEAVSQTGVYTPGYMGAPRVDPALDQAIRAANGNVERLDANLRALASQRPDLKDAVQRVSDLAAEAVNAGKDIRRLGLEIESLEGGKLAASLLKPPAKRKPPKGRDGTAARDRLEEFGEDAADKIREIGDRFSQVPPQVQQVSKSIADLHDIIDDLNRKKPPGFEKLVDQAEQTRAIVEKAVDQPYQEYLEAQVQAYDIQQLINEGRLEEAESVRKIFELQQQMGPLGDKHQEVIRATTAALAEQARQADIARQKQQMYLNALDDIRSNIEGTIANFSTRGLKGIGDFVSGLRDTFNQLNAEVLSEKVFGGIFREMEDWITGRDKVQKANADYAASMTTAREAVLQHAAALEADTNALARARDPAAPQSTVAQEALSQFLRVKDEIVVTGQRLRDPSTFIQQFVTKMIPRFKPGISPEDADRLGKKVGSYVSSAFQGMAYGQAASALFFGSRGSSAGSAIGGALGNAAGEKIGKIFEKQLGEMASFAGPLGSIVGGLAGSLIGNAITPAKRGSATIAVDSGGNLKVASVTGNSSKFRQASGDSADAAIATIERIAEQLGATVTGKGSVSIGIRDGKYRVDTTGRGITKTKKGAIDFGEDAAAAVKAATLDLIKDGILGGLRAGTQRLLQNSKDLEAGLDKALRFESVFTTLKQHLDPVGAAVDEVEKRFKSLRQLFAEAGAGAAELADLEKLYGIERKQAIEQAGQAMTSALKGLLDDLTVNNDALSLRDRLAAARAKYDPLAADLAAGKKVDFDAFAEAGRAVEAIIRQIEGSGSGYFAFLDELTGLTSQALAKQEALIAAATGTGSGTGTPPPGAVNDNAPVVGAVDRLGNLLVTELGGHLDAVNRNLRTLIGASSGSDGSGGGIVLQRMNF